MSRPLGVRLLWMGVGFVVLDVYLNVPNFVRLSPVAWLGLYAAFFPLAHGVGRLTGAGGLGALGLAPHRGWARNLWLGFVFCSAAWALKYAILWALGAFHVEGARPAGELAELVFQAAVAMFLSSATDDVLVRGFLFRHLSGVLSAGALVALTTFVYVLNHVWYMQLTLESSLYLGLLGLMFSLALVRTGSLWLSIGLHWGGNVVYRLYDGFDARGGVLRRVMLPEAPWQEGVKLAMTALSLAALFLLFRFTEKSEREGPLSARG
ncbi:CPBP family intramembrane metalloprotease [Archangium violaceum]|uniref:CPBP family intramembrane glutamic endopeptidase n=1 Tax=Archangium violaceum TaxID=83451 RepID=UPI00193B486B|nr:CPBP family intramembrane glutamic endopeptidase [Archangium violaceum]QRK13172.1 CPBP family intramembrane metalloprotease [Archangium violaceum]